MKENNCNPIEKENNVPWSLVCVGTCGLEVTWVLDNLEYGPRMRDLTGPACIYDGISHSFINRVAFSGAVIHVGKDGSTLYKLSST